MDEFQTQNQMPEQSQQPYQIPVEQQKEQSPKGSKKTIIIAIIIIVILAAAGIFYWRKTSTFKVGDPGLLPSTSKPQQGQIQDQAVAPLPSAPVKEDTTSVINQGLESVDIENLDKDFQSIDTDLKNL